jgi:hypothetical protein
MGVKTTTKLDARIRLEIQKRRLSLWHDGSDCPRRERIFPP